jgi:hypothetical protein
MLLFAEVAMKKSSSKPKRQRLCQGASRRDDPCDRVAQRRCSSCGLWLCRTHFSDPEWHSCAPDQGDS